MQPILAPTTRPTPPAERSPARNEARSDFAHFLASADEAEHTPTREDHPPEEADHPKNLRPERPEKEAAPVRPEDLMPLIANPLLQEFTAVLPENLPEVPEIPEELEVTVRLGAMPTGPRIRLDTPKPQSPKAAPEALATEPLAPLEAEPAESAELAEAIDLSKPVERPEHSSGPILQADTTISAPKLGTAAPAPVERAEVPELPAPMPKGLNLEIKDAAGNWELGVVRDQSTVHLEFHGDAALRTIVQESSHELGQRIGRHGDSLGSVTWRPIAATPTAQDGRTDQHEERRPPEQQQQNQERTPERQAPRKETPTPTRGRALRVI